MATGYTGGLTEQTTLREFILRFIHEFPPKPVPPSTYYVEKVEAAKAHLAYLEKMSEPEAMEEMKKERQAILDSRKRVQEKSDRLRRVYDRMETLVSAWAVPPALERLKVFMLSQIRESRDFDCHGPSDDDIHDDVVPKAWIRNQISYAKYDIEFYEKRNQEEIDRRRADDEHISAFMESLPKE